MIEAPNRDITHLLVFPKSVRHMPAPGACQLSHPPRTRRQLIGLRKGAVSGLMRRWEYFARQVPDDSEEARSRYRKADELWCIRKEARSGVTMPPDRLNKHFRGIDYVKVFPRDKWEIAEVVGFRVHRAQVYVKVVTLSGEAWEFHTRDWRMLCACDEEDLGDCPTVITELWVRKIREIQFTPNPSLLVF